MAAHRKITSLEVLDTFFLNNYQEIGDLYWRGTIVIMIRTEADSPKLLVGTAILTTKSNARANQGPRATPGGPPQIMVILNPLCDQTKLPNPFI